MKRFCQIVPALMPATATNDAASVAAVTPPPMSPSFGASTMTTPAKPGRQPGPVARQDGFAEQAAGQHRGDERLQADDQRRKSRRHAVVDRPEHAAEIDAVHQHARDGRHGDVAARHASGSHEKRDDSEDRKGKHETHREEGERLRPGHGVARADEAGRPEDDEESRDDPHAGCHFSRHVRRG